MFSLISFYSLSLSLSCCLGVKQLSSAMCVCMCCCFPWKRGENKNESNLNEANTQPLIMKPLMNGGPGGLHD